MCAMTKELLLDFAELRYIAVECPRCHAEITVDAENKAADDFPVVCPCCRESLGPLIKININAYKAVYKAFVSTDPKDSDTKVRVRIRFAGATSLAVGQGAS